MNRQDEKAIEKNPALRWKYDIKGLCPRHDFEGQARLARAGNYDELVRSMLPLAFKIAYECKAQFNLNATKSEHEWDDLEMLITVANEALVKAVRAWDPDRGSKASTYVYQSIRRDVMRHIHGELDQRVSHISMDHVPENAGTIGDEADGEASNAELLSDELLDHDMVEAPDYAAEQQDLVDHLRQQIQQLTPIQRQAVSLYLYSPACEGNYAAVGQVMGITRQAAKQLIERAFTSLRSQCNISL